MPNENERVYTRVGFSLHIFSIFPSAFRDKNLRFLYFWLSELFNWIFFFISSFGVFFLSYFPSMSFSCISCEYRSCTTRISNREKKGRRKKSTFEMSNFKQRLCFSSFLFVFLFLMHCTCFTVHTKNVCK